MKRALSLLWIGALVAALTGCEGEGGMAGDPGVGSGSVASPGPGSTATAFGTLRVSLTDNPACGYDEVWVTVERVRVHRSSTAGDGDSGWVEIARRRLPRLDADQCAP